MKKSYWIAIAIIGGVLLLILLAGTILLGNWIRGDWGMMSGWPFGTMHGWGPGWIGMIFMMLIPVGFVLLVVLGIIGLVRGLSSTGGGNTRLNQGEKKSTSPRDILQVRYAGGEITREQYLQMLEDLT